MGVPPPDGEGNAYELPGRDLVELTVYLQSKLLWSTERNSTALLHHFLDNLADLALGDLGHVHSFGPLLPLFRTA